MTKDEIIDDKIEEVEERVVFEVDPEIKEEFLEKQEFNSTKGYYRYILKLADDFEVKLGKPIYNFNTEERDELLIVQYKNKNTFAFQSVLSPLKTYIDFCISPKNLVKHNENRFAIILTSNYKEYINVQAKENSYIPLSECRELQSKLKNYQDRLILELPNLGVRGRTEKGNTLEELVNLKEEDIKWEKKRIYLTKNNVGEKRWIKVDDYTLDLIKKVIDQDFYVANNGLKTKPNDDGIYETTDRGRIINPSEYVFRTPGKNKHGKVDYQFFASRIQRIQKWLKNPYISISNLYFSAIIEYAKGEKKKKGELTKEDYIRINERFEFGENGEKYLFKTKELIATYLNDER